MQTKIKKTRKSYKKKEKHQPAMVNGLRIQYKDKLEGYQYGGFAVTFNNKQELKYVSEHNKVQAINWAKRRAFWSKKVSDKYLTLIREFLLIPYGHRFLDQEGGITMQEVNRNTVIIFQDGKEIIQLHKLDKDVICKIGFYKNRKTIYDRIKEWGYTPYAPM